MATKIPYSERLESRVIGGLLKHKEKVWPDVAPFLTIEDFFDHRDVKRKYRRIFAVIKEKLEKKEYLDCDSVSDYLKSSGFDGLGGLDLREHLRHLSNISENIEGTKYNVGELIKYRIRRNLFFVSSDIAKFVMDDETGNKPVSEIVTKADAIYSSVANSLNISSKETVSLTQNLLGYVEDLTETVESSRILKTPFNTFNKAFGGLRLKDSYCFAGRPGHGKSALLQNLAYSTANLVKDNYKDGKPLPVLCIDTEMEPDEQRVRLAASIAGIDPYLIETGNWQRSTEMKGRVVEKLREVDGHNYDHLYAPRFSAEEMVSYIRRWVYKNVGKDGPGIIVFDYLKLSGSDLKNVSESRLSVAYKLDMIKDLVKEETNCVLLFGAQRNRYGENDDDSSIAESDHIQRLSTWTGIFKKKSNEELSYQPEGKFGTHALIVAKARKLGIEGKPFQDHVKIKGKFLSNWINFKFENFNFVELNTGREVEKYLDLES